MQVLHFSVSKTPVFDTVIKTNEYDGKNVSKQYQNLIGNSISFDEFMIQYCLRESFKEKNKCL